ncbi:Maf family nucleotide pyrophosphatase [Thiomicrorhabdus sp. zzn3]|uniref:Maf family protein n=1 Tax=Thiomicrorhabdus sp. zzn3 TaxID=3039775 RepID=UPI00243661D2|nr:Maf family nucleotide pyrophosphatase [Thiomicrorhabdus sp. zzn3]MDG6778291.1 Maf family nucleotide pyrophosphatase [Thiomicrorhabdus sp. zzn3]
MKTIKQKKQLPPIVLGSSSPFRKQLLEKLQLPFSQHAPDIDETPLKNESPQQLIERLSLLKAQAVAESHPEHIVIASDQCATFDNRPIGKPHTHENAVKQLTQFSGKTIIFYTGLVVIDPRDGVHHQTLDITQVKFRQLSPQTIENYLRAEQPYQCAGSFKSEGLGITLFEAIESQDPNALIGLPLIKLTSIFQDMGITLPLAD